MNRPPAKRLNQDRQAKSLTWAVFIITVRVEDSAVVRGPEKVVQRPSNGGGDQSGQVRRVIELVQERVGDGRRQLQLPVPEEVLVEVGVEGEREELGFSARHEPFEEVSVGKVGHNEIA